MYVVAGGRSKSTSEILDLDTLTWRVGPPMPMTVDRAYGAQYGNTFVVVHEFGIYEFDPENEAWITREETLDNGRRDTVAIFVSDNMVNCF